jgi:DNA polymerase III subunit gamma/tau
MSDNRYLLRLESYVLFMVFYRKYRPQTISELDNAAIREKLFSVLRAGVPHAFLFTGPKGLGKTSTARIVAKVVNCEKNVKSKTDTQKAQTGDSQLEPCNVCHQCVSITNGTNMDILEIDAASNRGIDEIRDLQEKIRLAPLAATKKVYIIDEVHMLTTEAFNALLKTLEEPPSHALFILCTTEQHKLPATIISRCFHLHFTPATEEELVHSFKRIVASEKVSITDEALQAIAKLSDRGFRDGAKILEEIVLLSKGKKITKDFLEEKYQVSGITSLLTELLVSLKRKRTQESLAVVQKVVELGIDSNYFLQQLIERLHSLLLVRIATNEQSSLSDFTLGEIKDLIGFLSKAHQEMKFTVLPQLPLELMIIEWCQDTPVQLVQDTVEAGGTPVTSMPTTQEEGVTVSSLRKQVGVMKKNQAIYGTTPAEKVVPNQTAEQELSLLHTSNAEITKEWLGLLWKHMILEMKQYNHTVAGVLRSCGIATYDKQSLVIQAKYKFHKERLDDRKTQEALSKICKLLTGNDVQVTVELKT